MSARYADPTARYPHGALGDPFEYGRLVMQLDDGRSVQVVLPENRVFEDVAPRLVDLEPDGAREVMVVESDAERGARLAVFGPDGIVAATPFIGRRFRWLAPVGAADLDGDGAVEVAYVDRPHLAKLLRVWRFAEGRLTPVAALSGVTNHSFGSAEIEGGIRRCEGLPEIVVLDAERETVLAVRLEQGRLTTRVAGAPPALARVMRCEE